MVKMNLNWKLHLPHLVTGFAQYPPADGDNQPVSSIWGWTRQQDHASGVPAQKHPVIFCCFERYDWLIGAVEILVVGRPLRQFLVVTVPLVVGIHGWIKTLSAPCQEFSAVHHEVIGITQNVFCSVVTSCKTIPILAAVNISLTHTLAGRQWSAFWIRSAIWVASLISLCSQEDVDSSPPRRAAVSTQDVNMLLACGRSQLATDLNYIAPGCPQL